MIREASKDIGDPDLENLDTIVKELRKNFDDGTTLDINFRKTALKNVIRGCEEMEGDIIKGLYADLKSDDTYAYMTNVMMLKNEAKDCLSHLNEWTAAKHAETPLTFYPGKSYVKPQPRGVVCVLGSWNFPINSLAPFVSAIAAGNAVIIKPSEFSPNSSHVMKKFFTTYLDQRYYRCVEGAVKTGIKLTSTAFDMICFTGSTFTGKLIAKAASEHLTPLILELGGKCPTVVDRNANIGLAAKRIVSGKFGNCGQVCLAPDYVFVHREVLNTFVNELKNQITAQFGADPKTNKNYGRLAHEDLLKGHEDKIIGKYGEIDVADKFFPPTLLLEPNQNSTLMKEEIFGPILPIYPYDSPIDVIDFIRKGARPLAVYYYGDPASKVRERLEQGTFSGSFVCNDSVIQFANNSLPFGGIGDSGYGTTHGYHGFAQFSNMRAVLERPNSTFLDISLRYHGSDNQQRLKMMKRLEFATNLTVDQIFCVLKWLIIIAVLYFGLTLGVKHRLIAFPAFGIN